MTCEFTKLSRRNTIFFFMFLTKCIVENDFIFSSKRVQVMYVFNAIIGQNMLHYFSISADLLGLFYTLIFGVFVGHQLQTISPVISSFSLHS